MKLAIVLAAALTVTLSTACALNADDGITANEAAQTTSTTEAPTSTSTSTSTTAPAATSTTEAVTTTTATTLPVTTTSVVDVELLLVRAVIEAAAAAVDRALSGNDLPRAADALRRLADGYDDMADLVTGCQTAYAHFRLTAISLKRAAAAVDRADRPTAASALELGADSKAAAFDALGDCVDRLDG